ncbi:Fur family transcriptional regulator [uncultured Propionibacterium sp.]|uniref:Fur family transcriptional regulator n=1 Tax=uncultured Propionibacterium sp. TaxID=218066 RepID=UPI002931A905|nr:Fur family transcriptional regulator [uncultured Propionibacterium sp.]
MSTEKSTTRDRIPPRNTRQRRLIKQTLGEGRDFRTAQQLHADLVRAGERASLATVYRVLNSLADNDEADTWRTPEGEMAYRRCSTARHHHHLICRDCGRTVEISGGPAERWSESIAAEHGFIRPEHHVEIFGTCPECAAREPADD